MAGARPPRQARVGHLGADRLERIDSIAQGAATRQTLTRAMKALHFEPNDE
jgi:hypothetical protein